MELTVNDLRTNKQSVKTYYVIITNKDGIRKYISSPKFYWERTEEDYENTKLHIAMSKAIKILKEKGDLE